MFIDSVIIGTIVGKISGGKFKELVEVSVTRSWLIVLAFMVQYPIMFFYPSILYQAIIVSYILLIIFCYFNRQQIGFRYILVGMLLNIIVMLANRGRMPVEVNSAMILSPDDVPDLIAGSYGKHIAMSDQTNFNFLGDIFFLQFPYPRPIIISLGDIIISIGVIMFIYYAMNTKNKDIKDV